VIKDTTNVQRFTSMEVESEILAYEFIV